MIIRWAHGNSDSDQFWRKLTHDPDALARGDVAGLPFGPFTIEQQIGRGGYSAVYRAKHAWLDTVFALKVLEVPCLRALERFRNEAGIGMKLRHPNIASVCMAGMDEFPGTENPLAWIATDLVDGINLAEHIDARGLMPERTAALIAVQILSGLEHVHRSGFVHGDVKPPNILVRPNGMAQLVDFGLAAPIGSLRERPAGTIGFMPPELWFRGNRTDPRADIYGAGVVLWSMLAGRYPSLDDQDRLPVLQPLWTVHGEMREIVARMTDPVAEHRFTSAGEAERALNSWLLQMSGRLPTPASVCRNGHRYTVLLAMPPSVDCNCLERVLEISGYRVIRAGTASKLDALMTHRAPDALVLDPDLAASSCEMIPAIREQWPESAVILLGDGARPNDRLRGLMCGADRYLVRPVSPVRIASEVARLVQGPRASLADASASETHLLS
ncbi:MAG: protein kinase [Planctomycetota bacterium]